MQENLVRGRAFDFDGGGWWVIWFGLVKNLPQTSGDIIFFTDINNLTM